MGRYNEECGIVGIVLKNPDYKGRAAEFAENMLYQLQHRGQQSAGIVTYCDNDNIKLKRHIGVGRVEDVFQSEDNSVHTKILNFYGGERAVGHTRYSTSGKSKEYGDFIAEAQPFLRQHGREWKRFAIAFNGNLANYKELAEDLLKNEYLLDTDVDTEVIMHHISASIKKLEEIVNGEPKLQDVLKEAYKNFDGAYNIVLINGKGHLTVTRDSLGIRPLFYANTEDIFAAASESAALTNIGLEEKEIKEVQPGEMLLFDSKLKHFKIAENERTANCVFEPVYVMWDSSTFKIENDNAITVNEIRSRLGEELAKSEPLIEKIKKEPDKYVIFPVPSTPIPAAEAMSEVLGIPKKTGIRIKEHIVGNTRGFIEKQERRGYVMNKKYDIIKYLTEGKKIIVVDDSIVRGETSSIIAKLLRKAGAEEIHLRSTFPPIISSCFYGIDFPTLNELAAGKCSSVEEAEREIAKKNSYDSVHFQTMEGLLRALNMEKEDCCLACLNKEYPTPFGQKRLQEILEKEKD